MSLSFDTSVSGDACASCAGIRLHSYRDPREEARRFLSSALTDEPATILFLGPCLSYLVEAARDRFPGALLVSAQYEPSFRGREAAEADLSWSPDEKQGLESFLLASLGPEDIESLRVLEWPPAARAFPAIAAEAAEAARNAVLSLNGAANALAAFGRAFLYNPVRVLATAPRFLSIAKRGDSPIVIAASGPSLEAVIPSLRELRGRYWLAALSSALPALVAAGILPDIVFSVDSGFWAMAHLGPEWAPGVPLAMSLAARVPDGRLRSASLLMLESGLPYEGALLAGTVPYALRAPTSATVAAAAIEASLLMSTGPVVIAAMDLSSLDLRSHARPNAFEPRILASIGRLKPLHSAMMEREARSRRVTVESRVPGGRRVSAQLETYAAYLSRISSREERLHRYAPGAPALRAVRDLDPAGFASLIEGNPGETPSLVPVPAAAPSRPNAAARARALIDEAVASFMSDGPLDELSRDVCSCLCLSSLLKRRKARRSGDTRLLAAAREEIALRRDQLERRLVALEGRP